MPNWRRPDTIWDDRIFCSLPICWHNHYLSMIGYCSAVLLSLGLRRTRTQIIYMNACLLETACLSTTNEIQIDSWFKKSRRLILNACVFLLMFDIQWLNGNPMSGPALPAKVENQSGPAVWSFRETKRRKGDSTIWESTQSTPRWRAMP